ncbi:hypothetical protein CTA2_7213, partial [Colletotrichum tanaceti]
YLFFNPISAYTEYEVNQALEAVANRQSLRKASIEWGIRIQHALSVAPTYLQVKLFAERILQAIGDTEPIGRGWISAFLKRNPSVKVQRSRPIDSRRINGASTEVIRDWFNLLAIPEIKGIKPANRYNMDETGILEGQGSNGLVLGMAKTKSVRKKQPGSRAWSSSSGFLWILALMKDSSLLQQRMDRLQMILQLNGCRRSSSLRPSLRARRKELGYLSQWNDSTIIGKRNFIGCYQKARLAGLTIDNIKSAKPLISPLMLPSTPGPSDQGSKGIQGQAGSICVVCSGMVDAKEDEGSGWPTEAIHRAG